MLKFKEFLDETSSWKEKAGMDKSKSWASQVRPSVDKERKRLEKIKNTQGYAAYLAALKKMNEGWINHPAEDHPNPQRGDLVYVQHPLQGDRDEKNRQIVRAKYLRTSDGDKTSGKVIPKGHHLVRFDDDHEITKKTGTGLHWVPKVSKYYDRASPRSEFVKEDWERAVMRKHGSVKPDHWNGKRFISDMKHADNPDAGFDHDRCNQINAQVEVGGKVVAGGLKKPLEEMARSKMPQPDTSSKVMTDRELVDHIGKTRANAVFNHPWHKRYMSMQSTHPNAYKVVTDKNGFSNVMVSSNFTFEHKGRKIRRMLKFDLGYKTPRVWNAHEFHNYDNERHPAEHGGGPTWHWIKSHKNDDEK